MVEDFDIFKEHAAAFERKKEKLKTFQTGDRVTKPWFTNVIKGPIKQDIKRGIFIGPIEPIDCLVLWEGKIEPENTPISMISHE